MRTCLFFLLLSGAVFAQSSTTSYSRDVNGRPVAGVTSTVGIGTSETRTRNLNGDVVPVSQVSEKLISESGGTRVVEQTVNRYTANGQPGQPERIRIEESKNADGTTNVTRTVLRADLNGAFVPVERTTSQSRKEGARTLTEVVVERPNLNGGYALAERKSQTVTALAGGGAMQESVVLRPDLNGHLQEAFKETAETSLQNGQTVQNTAAYERNALGQMELSRQTVSTTLKRADGSEQRVVNVYENNAAGRAGTFGGSKPALKQQQIIEKSVTAGGTVERMSVRRPLDSDPARLGAPQPAEETVCQGPCGKDGKP